MGYIANTAFFSVIIPTYNRLPYLKLALNSVLGQDFQNFEVIIVDDGSEDGTLDWLQEMQTSDARIKVIHQKQQGVSAARNTGLRSCTSSWIALLDSDDEWQKNKLSHCHKAINSYPDHFIFHSDEVWIRNGQTIKQNLLRPSGDVFLECVKNCCIGPSTSVFHQKVVSDIGGFRADFPVCEDYDFWLRASAKYLVVHIPEALVLKHGGHPDQLSTRFHSMDLWRLKALSFQLWNPFLNTTQKRAVAEAMFKKSEILLKGFSKHNNFTHQNEVLILQSACKELYSQLRTPNA